MSVHLSSNNVAFNDTKQLQHEAEEDNLTFIGQEQSQLSDHFVNCKSDAMLATSSENNEVILKNETTSL